MPWQNAADRPDTAARPPVESHAAHTRAASVNRCPPTR